MPVGQPALLRYRVVNRSPNFYWSDGFEVTGGNTNLQLWHSLGNEAGTDNSIAYWNQVAGVWTYAGHVITSPATANNLILAGHTDWGDIVFNLRFQWNTNTAPGVIIHCDGTYANLIGGQLSSSAFSLFKRIASVESTVGTQAFTPTTGTIYWLQVIASSTTYSVNLFNDSAGAVGSQIGTTVSGTISDAGVQNGQAGLRTAPGTTASFTAGGVNANVCSVTGTAPGGAIQDWVPVVTTGEPAFAWSKLSPRAGTYSASIQIVGSSSGNGAWQQATRLATGTSVTVSGQVKASAGTANVSAGGVTTGNAGTTFGLVSGVGSMTVNPTVSCNYSGAVGTAYFDTLSITNPAYEITNDLPHPHQSTWTVMAMQPGNPSNAAMGSFTIPLYPPGSKEFYAAKATYDQLDLGLRVEAYSSPDGASLGKLYQAGMIRAIEKVEGEGGDILQLTGTTDLGWANASLPFPGELLSNDVSSQILKSYLGTNELGASDTFNPFTAGNYTSTAYPTFSAGSWSSTTDDGFNVVSCSTGTGAVLISKTGATANDRWHTHYVECIGRLSPSADATNAGKIGIGLSSSSANMNNGVIGLVTAKKTAGRIVLDTAIQAVSGGTPGAAIGAPSALINVDDPDGFVRITIGLLITTGGNGSGTANASLVVNGKVVVSQYPTSYDPGTTTKYPYLFYGTPATGSATCYLTNLVQMTRFTADGPSSASAFATGTITTSTRHAGFGIDPGPTFLEIWSKLATREVWYWRYTPQAYTNTSRTLGTVDFAADPGTDRTSSCIFKQRLGNLISLRLSSNADAFASGTQTTGLSSPDGGGIGVFRDITTMTRVGVIEDITLAFNAPDHNTMGRYAYSVVQNKITIGNSGAKTAVVLRDAETTDVWRELDKLLIDHPDLGVINLTVRVLGYTFAENDVKQPIQFDQFSPTTLFEGRLL